MTALAFLCSSSLAAQNPPAPQPQAPPPTPGVLQLPIDTTGSDTTAKKDTTKTKRDTVVTPFAQWEFPAVLEMGKAYDLDRDELFNTGALTLIQVLNRVPGLTVFASGWITSPQYASYLGNPARLRVFLDGVELIALGNDRSYPLDLATVPIWNIEHLTLERGPDEIRIYIRTWTVTHTHMQSRVDIVTGDLGTNMLRAYFGKRWENGFGFQFGGQVFGTANVPLEGSGSANDLMLRFGWARGMWSADLYAERGNGTRDPQVAFFVDSGLSPGIPGQVWSREIGAVRVGYGQPESTRWWGQVVLNQQQVLEQNLISTAITYVPPDSLPKQQRATQLIFAGGLNAGPLHASAAEHLRWFPSGSSDEVTGRIAFTNKFFTVSGYGDYVLNGGGLTEAAATITPTSYLLASATIGKRTADSASGGDGVSGRVSVGFRLARVWFKAGAVRRAATVVPGLVGYDTAYVSASSAQNTGYFGSVSGKLVDDVGINFYVVRWQHEGWYLPQLQERGEAYLDTQWLSKFPTGNFSLKAAFGEEYRSDVLFPTAGAVEQFGPSSVSAVHSVVMFSNIEVRVLTATLYFTATWALTPRPYELVPQYVQPVQVYTYGLRWAFWN